MHGLHGKEDFGRFAQVVAGGGAKRTKYFPCNPCSGSRSEPISVIRAIPADADRGSAVGNED
jgi:hypothetical protein